MVRMFRKSTMRASLIMILSLLLASMQLSAQGWSVNPADYENSGDITAIVYFDGVLMTDGALGAFVNDECRGFDDLAEPGPGGFLGFQYLIYSNVSTGETISFRYYNESDGQVYDVVETVEFVSNMILGNAIEPIVFNAVTNAPPFVSNPIGDQEYDEYFASDLIDLNTVFSDPDLNPLTYTVVSSDESVVTVGVSGSILTITEAGLGTSALTVTADDGLETADYIINVTVNNVNDAPEVVNPLADISRDEFFGTETVDLSTTFTDKDGDVLTLTATSGDEAVVTVSVTGTTLTISEVEPGTSLITVNAFDGTVSTPATFTFTMVNVNETPVIDNPVPDQDLDEYFGSRDISLAGRYSDPDGDGLTLTVVSSDETVVTAAISGSTLTLSEAGLGTSTISVTASDGTLNVIDAFSVVVNNVNDAPEVVASIPDQALNEFFGTQGVSLAGVFSDKDGDDLTYTAVSADIGVVTVDVNGTNLTITEVNPGTTTVTVTADDGTVTTDTEFSVAVNGSPQVASPLADLAFNEGFGSTVIEVAGTFSDPEADPLTYGVSIADPAVAQVEMNGTLLTISEGVPGITNISVTASDGSILSATDVFEFDLNGAPIVTAAIPDYNRDAGFANIYIDLDNYFGDPESDPLTYTAVSSDEGVVTTSISGSILRIIEGGSGIAQVTVTAGDGSSLEVQDIFTVDVNGAPVVSAALVDVFLDEGFVTSDVDLTGIFSDPDDDALTYTVSSSNPGVVQVGVSGSTVTLTEVGIGTANVTVTASDGSLSAQDVFIVDINGGPVVTTGISDRAYNEGFGTVFIDLDNHFSDPDGDPLTYAAVSNEVGVVTVGVSGNILQLNVVGHGLATITVTAEDGSSLEATDVFLVDVNGAPVVAAGIDDVQLNEGFGTATVDLTGAFSDPDGDALTYTASSSDLGVVVVGVSGNTLTLTEVDAGTANITVTARDGSTLSAQDVFTVTVNGSPAVAAGISNRNYNEGFGSADINLASVFTDPDGDPLTYTAVSADETVVTVSLDGTTLTINEAGLGSTSITVNASDGALLSPDVVFVVDVNGSPLVASGINDVALNEDFGTYNINLTGVFSDPESDPLTITAVSATNAIVTVNVSGNTLTITEVDHGSTTVTVTAGDGSGLTASTGFSVTVNGAPDIIAPIGDITLNNGFGSTTVDISAVFTDPEGDALSYSIANSNPTAVTASLGGTLITIEEATYGTATISVIANDGQLSTTEQFVVTVNVVLPADWTYEPANYDYDGQLTAQVYIDRDTVRSGFLGAFVDGQCRGIVDPIYFAVEDYFVFNMIVYSDVSTGSYLKFKYYDYETDTEYELYDSVPFTADMILGDAFSPQELHYYLSFENSFVSGWSWFSMNLDAVDKRLGTVMPECVVEGDYIKNQTVSATYYDGFGWFGNLEEIDPTMLYKTRINSACGISAIGNSVDIPNTPIPLVSGWNWIGYLPGESLPIDEALASYGVSDLDYIKNQVSSATYYDGFGWYGSMKTMNPGEGFMIKVNAPSTLVYPESSAKKAMYDERSDQIQANPDPRAYEFSGTVTARVFLDGEAIGSEDDLLMAYVGDEIRGVIPGMYFDPANAYAYQLLIYSNLAEGEELHFKYYHAASDRTYDCIETLAFRSDMIVADARQAFALNLDNAVGIDGVTMEEGLRMHAYPNPFRNNLRIDITVQEATHMRLAVYDLMGKMMMVLEEQDLAPGTFSMEWKASGLPAGTYVLKAEMNTGQMIQRVTLVD